MQLLVRLYDRTLVWSQHKYAPGYLAAVSFIEASVFPIPPYFMLAPMALAKPSRAFQYALIATVASVFGGLLGYLLGYLVFPLVLPIIEYFGYSAAYTAITAHFQEQGFWAILVAGFMPIPFKLIAIGAGFMRVPIWSFFLASILGRGVKFFAVSLLIRMGGAKMEQHVRNLIAKLGFIMLALVGVVVALKYSKVI
jgi:membrane protein YqaA with SNARE-associated domain